MRPGQRRLGLALGGGGLLGVAHIGVLEVLEENGIRPGIVTGTSAGSFVAALYAAGIGPAAMRELALKLRKENLYAWNLNPFTFMLLLIRNLLDLVISFEILPRGLLTGSKIAGYVDQVTGKKNISDISFPIGLVAVDLLTGKRVVFSNRDLMHPGAGSVFLKDVPLGLAVRASTAIPGVFDPVPYRGMLLADGGLVEMVPTTAASQLGARVVVAVRLGGGGKISEPGSIVQVIMRGIGIMNEQGAKRDLAAADLVIEPHTVDAGLGDFEHVPELLDSGREVAVNALPDLKRLLSYC